MKQWITSNQYVGHKCTTQPIFSILTNVHGAWYEQKNVYDDLVDPSTMQPLEIIHHLD